MAALGAAAAYQTVRADVSPGDQDSELAIPGEPEGGAGHSWPRLRPLAAAAVASALLAAAAAGWCAAGGAAPAAPLELVVELDAEDAGGGHIAAQARGTPRRTVDEGCRARLRWLEEVAAQRLESPPDTLFPAEASSISGRGEGCGDSASNAHEHCSHFDHWENLSSVAVRQSLPGVVVFGSSVSPEDVDQGKLGDCYFLSALASVASACPKCIMDMFVHRQREESGVYTTRWLLNGAVVEVSIDSQIPARYGTPYFAHVSNGVFWPVILEKTWAKILGSYKNAEAGNWVSAVDAITRAPVKSLWHSDLLQEDLWKELDRASSMGFPMGASTGDGAGDFNLPQSHAYAVYRAYEDPKYGRVVMCFNPWHSDRYRGTLPNEDKQDGTFTMKLDEYYHAFRATHLGLVTNGYTGSFQMLQVSKQGNALKFPITSNRDFYVSVAWPMQKLVEPCQLTPSVNMAVAKQTGNGERGYVFQGEGSKDAAINMVTARVSGEAGTYDLFVGAEFPSEIADQVVVIVYANESVHITRSAGSASELALAMFGPDCSEGLVSFPGHGEFAPSLDSLVHGIPTYASIDNAEFAYYTPSTHLWFVTSASHWQHVSQGLLYYSSRVAASDVRCGCVDSPDGVRGLDTPCSQVVPPNLRYANVMCRGAEFSRLVERCCPVTCGACSAAGAAGAAPAPPPPPPPPPPPRGGPEAGPEAECTDRSPTGLRVKGQVSQATCPQLRRACGQDVVRERCCETCAADASRTAQPECEDERDPHLRLNHESVTCREAAEMCDNKFVRHRCCETCRLQDERGRQPSVKASSTA